MSEVHETKCVLVNEKRLVVFHLRLNMWHKDIMLDLLSKCLIIEIEQGVVELKGRSMGVGVFPSILTKWGGRWMVQDIYRHTYSEGGYCGLFSLLLQTGLCFASNHAEI